MTQSIRAFTLIAILVFIVYHPSLWFAFYADDYDWLRYVKDYTGQLTNLLQPIWVGTVEPVSVLVYLLLFHLFKTEALYYHVFQLASYSFMVFLFYRLLLNLALPEPSAFILSLLFSVLSSHFEVPIWIGTLPRVLSNIFLLLGINASLQFLRHNNRQNLYTCHIYVMLSALSQQQSVYFPFFVLVIWFFLFRNKKKVVLLLPACIISLIPILLYSGSPPLYFGLLRFATHSYNIAKFILLHVVGSPPEPYFHSPYVFRHYGDLYWISIAVQFLILFIAFMLFYLVIKKKLIKGLATNAIYASLGLFLTSLFLSSSIEVSLFAYPVVVSRYTILSGGMMILALGAIIHAFSTGNDLFKKLSMVFLTLLIFINATFSYMSNGHFKIKSEFYKDLSKAVQPLKESKERIGHLYFAGFPSVYQRLFGVGLENAIYLFTGKDMNIIWTNNQDEWVGKDSAAMLLNRDGSLLLVRKHRMIY